MDQVNINDYINIDYLYRGGPRNSSRGGGG